MQELLKFLSNADNLLTIVGWLLSGLTGLIYLIYRSMWKAINNASQYAEDAHEEAHTLTDGVYTYLEDVRRERDQQIQVLNNRLLVLETEHLNCQNKLKEHKII